MPPCRKNILSGCCLAVLVRHWRTVRAFRYWQMRLTFVSHAAPLGDEPPAFYIYIGNVFHVKLRHRRTVLRSSTSECMVAQSEAGWIRFRHPKICDFRRRPHCYDRANAENELSNPLGLFALCFT